MSLLLVEESIEFIYSTGAWIPSDYGCSFSCWFLDNNGTNNARCIWQISDASSTSEYIRGAIDGTDLSLRAAVNTGAGSDNADTANTFTTNTWNHGYFEFASTTSRKVSLNGGTLGESTTSQVWPSGLDSVCIGYEYDADPFTSSGDPWDGNVAHFAGWDAVLSTAERVALAAGACPLVIRPANLQIYLPLIGDSSGIYYHDEIGGRYTWNTNGSPDTSGDRC
jgi:hypothetical protein